MADPYERQLLAVFESCDAGGTGWLDHAGLARLCDQLHLDDDDNRRQLTDALLPAFTFDQFRDALLALLAVTRRRSDGDPREPSPEREVSPKFVFGQKKYGRRSRPESTEQENSEDEVDPFDDSENIDTFLPSDNDNDTSKERISDVLIDGIEPERECTVTPTSVHSVIIEKEDSESELRAACRRLGVGADGFLAPSELAMVCRAVGMEKVAEEVVQQVFAQLGVDERGRISFEQFLQLFHNSLASPPRHPLPLRTTPDTDTPPPSHLSSLDVTSAGVVSCESLADMWEAGGVSNAASLLSDLGLMTSEPSLASVAAVLEEELRAIASKTECTSPHVNVLTAALVTAQTQLRWTRSNLEQMSGERDKLHSDLAESNQRASLLANEVDDRHARMERASQMQIKVLEQRHLEQVRQLGVQLAADRDQQAATALRLEKRLAAQRDEEAKLRAELQAIRTECEAMEKENQSLSEQLAALEAVSSKAERDDLEIQQLQQRVSELESSSEQVASLAEQLARLRAETTGLRDRNDELTLQLEAALSAPPPRPLCKRQNSNSSLEGGGGGGTKRRGASPLNLSATGGDHTSSWDKDSPRLGKVRRFCTEADLSPDSVPIEDLVIGSLALRHSESGLEADLDTLDNSYTLSSTPITDKVTFNLGGREELYVAEIERLRTAVARLQRSNDDYEKRLAEVIVTPKVVAASMTSLEIFPASVRAEVGEDSDSASYAATQATESTEVQTSLDNSNDVPSADVDRLEKHCCELKQSLETVQGKILKILSEKKACNEENCALKQRVEELSRSLNDEPPSLENTSGPLTYTVSDVPSRLAPGIGDELKDSPKNVALKCFPFMNRAQTNSDSPYRLFPSKDSQNDGFKFENLSQFAFELSQSLSDTNFKESPLSELEVSPLSAKPPECERVSRKLEWGVEKCDVGVQSEEDETVARLMAEIGEHRGKCAELEASLELMRVEFEKCEDYWQGKLNEERAFSDQEQRLSDDKFAELEAKIQEYAELFGPEDRTANGRLPTIDERDSLEKQVTDLEEEFVEYRKSAENENCLLNEQIERLQAEIKELSRKDKTANSDKLDVGIQAAEDSIESRLSDQRNSLSPSKKSLTCVDPLIEVTAPECSCPCHAAGPRKGVTKRLRENRQRLQAECDMLQRRREIVLHQLSQMQQRSSMFFAPGGDRRLVPDVEVFHSLSVRLRHQELRCRHLQSALKHHQRHTDRLLQNAWDQYQADLSAVQKTLHLTQDKLMQQTKLYRTQLERLSSSDVLVKDLYKENAHLSALVQKLEDQNLFVDPSILASSV